MSTQTPSADWSAQLPDVQLDVRQGTARGASYALSEVDFLIGSVPGCDLRVPAESPAVLCLLARHPGGVSLRKLAATQTILVNHVNVSHAELADGDIVRVGKLEFHIHITDAAQFDPSSLELRTAQRELQAKALQLRDQVMRFQAEKNAFEAERSQVGGSLAGEWARQAAEFREREATLAERQAILNAKTVEYEADIVRLARSQTKLDEREATLNQQAVTLAQQTAQWQLDSAALPHLHLELESLRKSLADEAERLAAQKREQDAVGSELKQREARVVDLEPKFKQYEADILRLTRLQGRLEAREAELKQQSDEMTRRRDQLKADSAELEQQLRQADELRVQLADDEERLTKQKQEQDGLARQLAERAAALEGQQATLTVLRSRVERTREEIRSREQNLDQQRAQQETREADLSRRHLEVLEQSANMESERRQHALDREQWLQRGAVMDAAVRQLKQAQEQLALEEQRIRQEADDVATRGQRLVDSDAILQGRLTQLGETQERLELERQALRDRGAKLVEREQACEALQEQLRRRTDEIAQRQKEIGDRLQEYQTKFAELDAAKQSLDERDKQMQAQADGWRREVEAKAEAVRKQHAEVVDFEDKYKDQMNHLAVHRKSHAEERAQFHLEQQATLDKLAAARTEVAAMRDEAHALIGQLPDAELRAGTAMDRLGSAREQLRNHLGEIHQYVRQCQDEMEQLRARLQGDLDKLQHEEQSLRQNQDEHRLAMTAFRQQLIDWQGQIAELKRLLARDQTRLERKQAQADERAREIEVQSQQLSQHAEELQEQERAVADRRLEIDQHLVDMRDWYRRKLRELAGIPLMPDTVGETPTILPLPAHAEAREVTTEDGEAAIIPTERRILPLGAGADQGDHKLGQVLSDLQLIDGDALTVLLTEARQQRRPLRQSLLASGVVTLYQLALIEAGNVDGLMLGPVRVIDRLRHNAHETVYRIFDPRRGTEAILRHLSEADMTDAVRPDEFRQRFAQSMLNDPHLANTLEVMELLGRPAAVQEWLSGLPATDWPPLAAAPGVCYRLLTQAAQGLATAHQAGVIHGHLSDAHLLLTGDGILKIRGLGEPPWLSGVQHDEEPTMRGDLRALGKIAAGWCTPTGVRKGPKTKPLPDALVSVLYRLAAEGDAGYRDVSELLADLQAAAAAIPANAEAWDRLLKYIRDHGTSEVIVRQSA